MTQRILLVLVALIISACANVAKVETGEATIGERLVVKIDRPWNQFERRVTQDAVTWTNDGIYVDRLQFFPGIRDGEEIAPQRNATKETRPLKFSATMRPDEIVALYQAYLTRDGSTFTLTRIEPTEFLGRGGFRFEYGLVRKLDDVRLQGVAYGAVADGQLFVINYSAPRLGFFQKYLPEVQSLIRSARLKT